MWLTLNFPDLCISLYIRTYTPTPAPARGPTASYVQALCASVAQGRETSQPVSQRKALKMLYVFQDSQLLTTVMVSVAITFHVIEVVFQPDGAT